MFKKLIISLVTTLFITSDLFAANIYVDQTSADCSGDYSVSSRNCSGSDGDSYDTIQEAIDATTKGDVIHMRGGTYNTSTHGTYYTDGYSINIPLAKQGTAWTAGNFYTLQSYVGEWAIIDGDFDISTDSSHRCCMGLMDSTDGDGSDIAYWLFERFEMKECGTTSGSARAAAIGINGGPFKFRYLYIHDNYTYDEGNNPAGLRFYHLHDSTIEYCTFSNNGYNVGVSGYAKNIADIQNVADYGQGPACALSGYIDTSSSVAIKNNVIRYNYFMGGSHTYKSKGVQCFTERASPTFTHEEKGIRFHHNISQNYNFNAQITEDFAQIYNNIIDTGEWGITLAYEDGADSEIMLYQVVYNNLLMDYVNYTGTGDFFGIARSGADDIGVSSEPFDYPGYDYNNIMDDTYGARLNGSSFTVGNNTSDGSTLTLTNYYNSHNYFYRPSQADLFSLVTTNPYSVNNYYTQAEFEAQSLTHTPRVAYSNAYDAGNLLYKGTSGSDKYVTEGTHQIEGGVTVADGGVGGVHPYLSGVIIPSYVGATNPNDYSWVAGVLGLDVSYMTSASGDPGWIEGGAGDSSSPTPNPMTWAVEPHADSQTQISMTATTGSDDTPPIEYYFDYTNSECGECSGPGGTDSGWQSADTTYTDSGLQVDRCYGYTVQARDAIPNTGIASAVVARFTKANTPGPPILSNPTLTTLDIGNDANGNPTVGACATTFAIQCVSVSGGGDASWLNKWVDGTGDPGSSELWALDGTWDGLTINNLTSGLQYGFKVKARNSDTAPNRLSTPLSSEGQGTTVGGFVPQVDGAIGIGLNL